MLSFPLRLTWVWCEFFSIPCSMCSCSVNKRTLIWTKLSKTNNLEQNQGDWALSVGVHRPKVRALKNVIGLTFGADQGSDRDIDTPLRNISCVHTHFEITVKQSKMKTMIKNFSKDKTTLETRGWNFGAVEIKKNLSFLGNRYLKILGYSNLLWDTII